MITAAAIGAIGAGASLASSIYGKYKEAQARNKYEDWINKQSKKLDSWYAKESNTDFLDTAEGRSTASGLKKTLTANLKNQKEGAIKTGGSHEAEVADKGNAFESLGDSYRKLAGLGSQRKANLRSMYMNQKGQYDAALGGTMQGEANAFSTFANNAGGSISDWINVGVESGAWGGDGGDGDDGDTEA